MEGALFEVKDYIFTKGYVFSEEIVEVVVLECCKHGAAVAERGEN